MRQLKSLRLLSVVFFFVIVLITFSTISYGGSEIFEESSVTLDDETGLYALSFKDGVNVSNVISSNNRVASISYFEESLVYIFIIGVGKATITATDNKGNTDTCNITVKPPEFILGDDEIKFNKYREDEDYVNVRSETNSIKSVVSSNTKVAKASLIYNSIEIKPVGAGNATITVTDVYNQKKTIAVQISKKYIDKYKYMEMLKEACSDSDLHYLDTQVEFATSSSKNASSLKNVTIKVEIDGVIYQGKYKGFVDYWYTSIVKVPAKPIGTKTKYTLSIGEAVYTYNSSVKKGEIRQPDIWTYDYTYTGKPIKPRVVVDYFFEGSSPDFDTKVLKKGKDYRISYSNNKNVGTAKIIAKGIGNYTGKEATEFTILPKGTTIKSLTGMKKTMMVKWKKQDLKMSKSRISGYQIRYSTKKNMSKSSKVNIKKYSKTRKMIRKLKSNKKYYVQIRTYKVIKKKPIYSKWSKKRTVKTL